MIIVILCIIIVILIAAIAAQRHSLQAIRARRIARVATLDNADARAIFIAEKSKPAIAPNLDADDLFTLALMHVHNLDDIQDKIEHATPAEKRKHSAAYNATQKLAREAMERAIARRKRENGANNLTPIFHDTIIEMHAQEMGIPHEIAQIPQPAPLPATIAPPLRDWAPDPENVHDSAVGGDVSAKIARMRDEDLHIMQPNMVIGNAIILAQNRAVARDKYQKILTTLNIARMNSHCARYNISELEALRLVMERAYHAASEEDRGNIEDAILDALADCVDKSGNSTVCLVGRISRYVGALDIVDKGMPEVIHSADAYRNEILFSLGKMQRDGDITSERIDALIDTYRDKMPAHTLEKIRAECQSAI